MTVYQVRALGPHSHHRPSKTTPGKEYEFALLAHDGRLVFRASKFGLHLLCEIADTLNRREERRAA